jgi:hypothetical protein
VKFRIKTAIDISEKANEVYKFNNPEANVSNGNIDGLKVKDFQDINAILMSPPVFISFLNDFFQNFIIFIFSANHSREITRQNNEI